MIKVMTFVRKNARTGIVACLAVVITVSAIYLTPLKWKNLIEPRTHEIDPKEFLLRYQADPTAYEFIDVREEKLYAAAHAKGAGNIPIQNFFDPTVLKNIPRSGKTIVFICSGGKLSGVAYGYLEREGYLNLLHIQGGLQQWIAENLPVVGASVASST